MPAARTPPRRRLLSYRLGSLMLLFVFVSAPLAIVTNRAHRQRAAVEALRQAGAHVWYDYEIIGGPKQRRGAKRETSALPGPAWLRDWLGIDYVARVRRVRMDKGDRPDGTTWERLGTLDDLTELYLDDVKLSDADLQKLKGLRSLETLCISGASIGNGLAVLTEFGRLKTLNLERCRLSDKALEWLQTCDRLEELSLTESNLSAGRLARQIGLAHLRSLDLTGANIDDDALDALATMRKLECLRLRNTLVTGAGLSCLPRPELLTELSLRHTLLDEAGVSRLGRFSALQTLDVSDNLITIRGLLPLLALPKLQNIDFDVVAAPFQGADRAQQFQQLASNELTSTDSRLLQDADLPRRIQLIMDRLSRLEAANEWSEALAAFECAATRSHEMPAEVATALAQYMVGVEGLLPTEFSHMVGNIAVESVPIPHMARLKIDALFQAIVRRGDRPGTVFLAWAGTAPRTLAYEEAARWIDALPTSHVDNEELFHDIAALRDHALSCLAAAAALDAGPRAWIALVDSLPPSLQSRAATAWSRSDPDNAAAWYAAAGCGAEIDDESLLPRHAEILAAIQRGNRCPRLQIGAPWSCESIKRAAPLLRTEFEFGNGITPAFQYEQCWRHLAAQAYRNAIRVSAELGVVGRLAQAEELQLAADEMLRRWIVTLPRESHAVIEGFIVALDVLDKPFAPDQLVPGITARRHMRRHAVLQRLTFLWSEWEFLQGVAILAPDYWQDASSWPVAFRLDPVVVGRARNAAIDDWEREDRRLQAMPEAEIIALHDARSQSNDNDMNLYFREYLRKVYEVDDVSDN